jgi:GMP synthase (glutamine-hydrolysing)
VITLALRHVAFEDLGLLAPLLERRGHRVRYLDLPAAEVGTPGDGSGIETMPLRDVESADLVVILGGPVGVYETDAYPFLEPEIAAVARRIKSGGPTLGICLGAQIIAAALGARVYPGGTKEIGWAPVELTEAGERSVLGPLNEAQGPGAYPGAFSDPGAVGAGDGAPCGLPVLHWHGDTFDLPAGAELLASTALYQNQAFSFPQVLALQFHLEATAGGLESWYVGHAAEIAATPGIEVSSLRETGAERATALLPRASKVFSDWLDLLNL